MVIGNLYIKKLSNKGCWIIVFFITAFTTWLLIVIGVEMQTWQLEQALQAYDLDKNGSFDESEQSPAQQQAMQKVVNDTGRALAPFTGAVFGVFYAGVLCMGFRLYYWLLRKFDKNK